MEFWRTVTILFRASLLRNNIRLQTMNHLPEFKLIVTSVVIAVLVLNPHFVLAQEKGAEPTVPNESKSNDWEQLGLYDLSADGQTFVCSVANENGSKPHLLVGHSDGTQVQDLTGAVGGLLAPNSKTCAIGFRSEKGLSWQIQDLETSKSLWVLERPESSDFTPDKEFLIVRNAAAVGGVMSNGTEYTHPSLLVCSLSDGNLHSIPNVLNYDRSDNGDHLALLIKSPSGANTVRIVGLTPDGPKTLFQCDGAYTNLSWNGNNTGVAFLNSNRLVIVTGLDSGAPSKQEQTVVGDWKQIVWGMDEKCVVLVGDSRMALFSCFETGSVHRFDLPIESALAPGERLDRSADIFATPELVLFHTTPRPKEEVQQPASSQAVEVWRGSDSVTFPEPKPSPRPMLRWRLNDGNVALLDDGILSEFHPLSGGHFGLLLDGKPHAGQSSRGYEPLACYVVDLAKAQKKRIADVDKVLFNTPVAASPDCCHIAYFENGNWWVYDVQDESRKNLTGDLPTKFAADPLTTDLTGASCAQIEWLNNNILAVYDEFDVWLLSRQGITRKRLTRGREIGRRYRHAWPSAGDMRQGPRLYLSIFDVHTKASGYCIVDEHGKTTELTFGSQACSSFRKANAAESFIWIRERYDSSPNIWSAGGGGAAHQLTSLNVKQGPFPWARQELLQYKSPHGMPLEAVLAYPVDYDSNKKYPMIVRIHSHEADDYYQFSRPDQSAITGALGLANYSIRGYFALWPNIYRRPMDPGNATVECVEAGVRAALRTASIDEKRIGIMGHSFGGYGTAFVLCKSKLFRAGVAASMFSDWTNFGLGHGPGGAPALESLKFLGMPEAFWQNQGAYHANSVLYNAEGIETPLLLLHGKRDDFCDWHESQQLYRRFALS